MISMMQEYCHTSYVLLMEHPDINLLSKATGKCNVRIIYLNTHEVAVHKDIWAETFNHILLGIPVTANSRKWPG